MSAGPTGRAGGIYKRAFLMAVRSRAGRSGTDTIRAKTARSLAIAQAHGGENYHRVSDALCAVVALAQIEAALDFAEEDITL